MEDTELVDGLVFTQKSANLNGPRRVEKAKIGLIQFCISPPKTDVSLYFIQCLLSRVVSVGFGHYFKEKYIAMSSSKLLHQF